MRISDWSSDVCSSDLDSVPTPVDTISALLRSSGIDAPTAQLVAGLYSRALAAIPVDFSADASGHVRSYALFGDVQFRLTERLLFTVGFRYDHETNGWGLDQTARFAEIGRAHLRTPVPTAHLVCHLLLAK